MDVASSLAPTNIAVLKYWGKDYARGLNTAINSSLSLALSNDDLRAETVVVASSAEIKLIFELTPILSL